MTRSLPRRNRLAKPSVLAGVLCLLLQACSQAPLAPVVTVVPPTPELPPEVVVDTTPPPSHPATVALTPTEYRLRAARHVYNQHAAHLYSGPLPPLLQAVGVLNIEIGTQGEVRGLNWQRAPSHVPEVMRRIEQLIHQAAPFPVPQHPHSVTYTETWLWHKSGRFQLHTLSEGQLGEDTFSNAREPNRSAPRRPSTSSSPVITAKCPKPTTTYC